jgi:hypothetical protein
MQNERTYKNSRKVENLYRATSIMKKGLKTREWSKLKKPIT